MNDTKNIYATLDEILAYDGDVRLDAREVEFIAEMAFTTNHGGGFTEKQAAKIEQIWNELF